MISCLRLVVALIALLTISSIAADELKSSYSIRDRGQSRHFDISMEELQVKKKPQVAKFKPLDSTEDVRQRAKSLSESSGKEVELVLYERGVPRTPFTRRILTKDILVELQPNVDAEKLAQAHDLRLRDNFDGKFFIFETSETGGALSAAEVLRTQPGVISAEPQLAKKMQKRLVPNDPYFSQQWHLRNSGQGGGIAGVDVNITNVWNTYRGAGIRIGIIDDGVQLTHPDLIANINTTIDWDFRDNDSDPSPALGSDWHGTAVAGVAGARGNNFLGVTGSAYEATLVGLRLDFDEMTDQMERAAMLHSNAVIQVKNSSWGPEDAVGILEGPGPLTQSALQSGATTGRSGKGTIFVWAGGNGGDDDNANYDGYANSIYTFAIAALADNGQRADYSERGACLVVAAPSSSVFRQGITTTDLAGNSGYNYAGKSGEITDRNYTQKFTGTSSAAPLAAGVIALILQANPNLGYRDVKEILMRSATKNAPTDIEWRTNASGIHINPKFGAGLINAGKAIELATNWSNLGMPQELSFAQTNLALLIPDNDETGVTRTFEVTNQNFRVEHVTLTVNAPHNFFGDLKVRLTSPVGTESELAGRHSSSGSGYDNWKFSTVRKWGENANGIWTVTVADIAEVDQGTLSDLHLQIHGTVPEARLSLVQVSNQREITLRASAPGWDYALETSTNLVAWTTLDIFNITNSGTSKIVETNAPAQAQFYRTILLR